MPEIEIPAEISELLEPISSDFPTGENAEGSEEYIKLEVEIGNPTTDYKKWNNWATIILKEKNKHLRVAVWL